MFISQLHNCVILIFQKIHPSSSSIGTTAHCGVWPVEKCPSIFTYLPPTLSIFSLPALEDLLLLPLSVLSWVFPFFSSLPFLQWRSFWASYPPPLSPGIITYINSKFKLLIGTTWRCVCHLAARAGGSTAVSKYIKMEHRGMDLPTRLCVAFVWTDHEKLCYLIYMGVKVRRDWICVVGVSSRTMSPARIASCCRPNITKWKPACLLYRVKEWVNTGWFLLQTDPLSGKKTIILLVVLYGWETWLITWSEEHRLIVDELKTNLMSLAILFHLLCAQHISDINISIFRSLRLCWWITTSVVLLCKDGCFSN